MDIKKNIKLDNFISKLLQINKQKQNNKPIILSKKNINSFLNYIKSKIHILNIKYNLELSYIFNFLYNKFTKKQLDKYNILIIKKQLPKIKVFKKYDNIPYKKLDIIGKGSEGIVFSIKNHPDKVIKTIDINHLGLDIIFSQILIMEKLNNTNISPKIYDYYLYLSENNISVNIVQEKMDLTLQDWLEKKNILTDIYKLQIIDKLKQLHKLNILHDDIQTKNILVKIDNNKIKFFIADFGKSKMIKNIFTVNKEQELNLLKKKLFNNTNQNDLHNLKIKPSKYKKKYYYNKIIICFIILLDIDIKNFNL